MFSFVATAFVSVQLNRLGCFPITSQRVFRFFDLQHKQIENPASAVSCYWTLGIAACSYSEEFPQEKSNELQRAERINHARHAKDKRNKTILAKEVRSDKKGENVSAPLCIALLTRFSK